MWRTVIITKGEKLTLKENWLVVNSDGDEQRVPLGDIYSVVIDNRAALVSVGLLTALAEANIHVIMCDAKHIPNTLVLPLNTHYRPFGVLKKQMALPDEFKDLLWQKIVKKKVENQVICLRLVGVCKDEIAPIEKMIGDVLPGDTTNREAVAAKKYFIALFGNVFRRIKDDVTNAALNYGYAIIRSAVAKALVSYGYNCVLGIHHINEQNAYNLADDVMEPLRPLVDLWVDNSRDELFEELTKTNRRDLVDIVNAPIKMGSRKTKVKYAIDKYISSLTSAIEKNDPELLQLPTLIRIDELFGDDEDDK